MALNIQVLALCLLPLMSVCLTDGDQRPATAWRLPALPLSRSARQVDRHLRQHTKDESDGLHGGAGGGRSHHRGGKSSSITAVQSGQNLPVVSGRQWPSLPVVSARQWPSLPVELGSRKLSLPVLLKPGKFNTARRTVRQAADRSSAGTQPSPTASSRQDSDLDTLLRFSLTHGRRPPPGSFVARLPPGRVRGRPYLVRLPPRHRAVPPSHPHGPHGHPHGHRAVPPPRKGKRVVLIVPMRGAGRGWDSRRPVRDATVAPVVRDAAMTPAVRDSERQRPTGVRDSERQRPTGVQVFRDAEGGYRPSGNPPPLQRHRVLSSQKVYTLDNPRYRKSGVKGYGPPKLKDIISCAELDVSDCHV